MYGIPGGAVAPLFDALEDSPIQVVVCQHEGMAGYLACGEATATGRPGVVLVTSGPGVLNVATPVAAAHLDETPLLVLAGDVRTAWSGRGALQDGGPGGLDVASIFAPITRFRATLDDPERAESLLARAWRAATARPSGPALLRLPVDVAGTDSPSSAEERQVGPPVRGGDEDALARVAELLGTAEHPLLFAGVGARAAGVGPWLARIAEQARIPVVTDLEAKSVVPEAHPLCLGMHGPGHHPRVTAYLREPPDVLLAVGARMDDTATLGFSPALRPTRAFVQLDHDPKRLHRPWPADVAIHGDLTQLCLRLSALLPPPGPAATRREAAIAAARALPEAPVPPFAGPPFDPRSVIVALQRAWGHDPVYLTDVGNHLLFAARHLATARSGEFHAAGGLGGMGSGIGSAMGMAAALGASRPVVCVCGDGGLLMVGTELATCARYQIPVVLVVFDDAHLGMVEHGMRELYQRTTIGELPPVALADLARALGARAIEVRSAADLARPERIDGPLVLCVPIDPSVAAPNPRIAGLDAFTGRSLDG